MNDQLAKNEEVAKSRTGLPNWAREPELTAQGQQIMEHMMGIMQATIVQHVVSMQAPTGGQS